MATSKKSEPQGDQDIELRPDGWERFKEAVHAAAKSGPKHRGKPTPEAKERLESKGRVHKGKTRT